MRKHTIPKLCGLGLLLAALASPAKANLFRVTELLVPNVESSSVSAINNRGQSVGTATTADGVTHAILWSGAAARDLGTWKGSMVTPLAINDAGEIAGFANAPRDGPHALVWRSSGWIDLGHGYAQGMNSGGQVVGYDQRGTLWSADSVTDLGNALAQGINDAGDIVGYRYAAGNPIAVVWRNGVLTDLERNGAAYSINGAGDIVGESRSATGQYQATLWNAQGKSLLGTTGDGEHSGAFDINERDQVVGYNNTGALLWTGQKQVDLNAVLANPPGGQFRLLLAIGINEGGQIAAVGTDANNYIRGYVLTPIPEPASLALVLGGLCLLPIGGKRDLRS
ncbi:hypothetical protein ACL58G_29405 [Massilia sp. GER05]|uniref:hypothetical protein n=1 Tax=Massilia sp. GER05 TaxID=3394605 RepID=UPI003F86C97F